MKSESYARYYAKNRDKLIQNMRERYDPEAKHKYYEEHKEEMKTAMSNRYKTNKAQRNLTMLNSVLNDNPPEHIKTQIEELIKTENYKTTNLRLINFFISQTLANKNAEKSAA